MPTRGKQTSNASLGMANEEEDEDESFRNLMGPGDMTVEELQRIEKVTDVARKHRDEELSSSRLARRDVSTTFSDSAMFLSEPADFYRGAPKVKQLSDQEEFADVDFEWTEDDLNRIDLLSQPPSTKSMGSAWTPSRRSNISPGKSLLQRNDVFKDSSIRAFQEKILSQSDEASTKMTDAALVEQEFEKLRRELSAQNQQNYSKQGEVSLLRSKLRKYEEENAELKQELHSQREDTENALRRVRIDHEKDLDRLKTDALFQCRESLEMAERSAGKSTAVLESKTLDKFGKDFDNGFLQMKAAREPSRRRATSVERGIQTAGDVENAVERSDQKYSATLKDRLIGSIEEDYDPFWQIHPLLHLLQIRDAGDGEEVCSFSETLFKLLLFHEQDRTAEFELACLLANFMHTRLVENPCRCKDVFASGQCLLALVGTSESCRSAFLTGTYVLESDDKRPLAVNLLDSIWTYLRHLVDGPSEFIDEATEHVLSLLFQFSTELTFESADDRWIQIYLPLVNEELLFRIIDRLNYRPSITDAVVLLCRLSEAEEIAVQIVERKFKPGRIASTSGLDEITLIDLILFYVNVDDGCRHAPESHDLADVTLTLLSGLMSSHRQGIDRLLKLPQLVPALLVFLEEERMACFHLFDEHMRSPDCIQLARRTLRLLHNLLIVYNETQDVLSFLTKPLYRMYIIMFYELYVLRHCYREFQDLRDLIKDLLVAVVTEEQEEWLFRIDQQPEPLWTCQNPQSATQTVDSAHTATAIPDSSSQSGRLDDPTLPADDPNSPPPRPVDTPDENIPYIWVM